MSDLKRYIQKRKKKTDAEFAKDFESGYEEFKIGEKLKQARVEVGFKKNKIKEKFK